MSTNNSLVVVSGKSTVIWIRLLSSKKRNSSFIDFIHDLDKNNIFAYKLFNQELITGVHTFKAIPNTQ